MLASRTAAGQALRGRALWAAFAAATTGTFMVNVDASVVNVALPVLAHRFLLPVTILQWAITAYLLVITGTLPLVGRLADSLGRKEVFVAGIAAFTLGSILSALAPDFAVLVAARAFQGLGGATIQANVMAIVALLFPRERRGQALGLIGSVVAAGTLFGPPLGGLLTATWGWRSIFWINVPIGLWGVWASWHYLPRFPRDPAHPLPSLDWAGAAWFLAAVTALQLGLSLLHSPRGWALTALAAGLTALFVRREARAARPLVPPSVFRNPPFTLNLLAGLDYFMLLMFPAFLLPIYLGQVLHLPVGLIGLLMTPQALLMIVVSPWGGRLADRIGVLWPARAGLLLFAAADLGFVLLPGRHAGVWPVLILLALVGVAAGLFSSPNNSAVLGSVPPRDLGLGSSLLAIQRNLGRSLGVALASILLSLIWMAHGLSPDLSPRYPHYAAWFLMAFKGVFLAGAALAAAGLVLVRTPPYAHAARREPEPGTGSPRSARS
ncbi:MFS domain-containing protein [Candidatus Hydrogenisulfobacillus filiaventi]|uniref:MFS domain-containing protein n=1 Tax=Candidatus Hydrogenisulfobacillus filiaventi TaxID=2707344 RepID=A0A6F8ZCQ3_9FIRM|nr:MFS domain-containing protein [Candidatus Hydrogenisulfobacillus filiaventi]